MIPEEEVANYEAFRDCLSELVLAKLSNTTEKRKRVKGRKNEIKPVARPVESEDNAAEELGDFIDVSRKNCFSAPSAADTVAVSGKRDIRHSSRRPPVFDLRQHSK